MKTRITGPAGSCYHVFSRIIERRFYLGHTEKEAFQSLLWRVAEFSGIEILTYCILDNHFHLLVQVPERIAITDEELLGRLKLLYGTGPRMGPYNPVRDFEQSEDDPLLRKKLRAQYTRRMYDLSEFMRTLKLRYSFWFNRTHERRGTLWDMRFKSVLVEGVADKSDYSSNQTLITVAAYIDLNCVRAGIVEHSADYRWCGYAEAVAGSWRMRKGFEIIYGLKPTSMALEWKEIAAVYQDVLYGSCKMSRIPPLHGFAYQQSEKDRENDIFVS